MSTPEELLAKIIATQEASIDAKKATRIVGNKNSYKRDNPGEYTKVMAYLDGGSRPTGALTEMGRHLILEEDVRTMLVNYLPSPPVPSPDTPPLRDWAIPDATATGDAQLTGSTSVAPFSSITREADDRIQLVSSPQLGAHPRSVRIEVRNGDVGGSSGWRAELQDWSGTPETSFVGTEYVNTDFWYPQAWYFPAAFVHQQPPEFGILMQMHANLAGGPGPTLSLETAGTTPAKLRVTTRSGDIVAPVKTNYDLTSTIDRDVWHEVIFHFRRRSGLSGSPAAEGLVEVWHRIRGSAWPGSPQVSHTGANFMHNAVTDERPNALQTGFYRGTTVDGLTHIFYMLPPWRCDSFASADAYFD